MTDQLSTTQPQYGTAVTAQASPDMTVAVAAGSVLVGNAAATVTAGNVTISAAHSSIDRTDAIVVDSTGTKSVIAGTITETGNVQPPSTTGYAVLAYVHVPAVRNPAFTGTITSGQVDDKRAFALVQVSPYRISGLWYGPSSSGNGAVWTNQDMWLIPFFTAKSLAVQAIGISVLNPAATAGSKARLGIYSDDGTGVLSLLVDAGQVAIDAGVATPSAVISTTLNPGWSWLTLAFQSLGATKPTMSLVSSTALSSPIGGSSLANVVTTRFGSIVFSGISGALPTTPTSPTYAPQVPPAIWVQAT